MRQVDIQEEATMAVSYPSPALRVSNVTHEERQHVVCTFWPSSGYANRCRDIAQHQRKPLGPNDTMSSSDRRCDRHLLLDQRVAKRRRETHGYATEWEYIPFDANAVIVAKRQQAAASAEHARLVERHERGINALRTLIHVADDLALSEDEQRRIRGMLNARVK